jgi:hypothetical protein
MKLTRTLIVAGTFWPAFAYSHTAFMNGNKLLDYCTAPSGTSEMLVCQSYVIGVNAALVLQDYVCLPDQTIVQQNVDVAVNYLRANPAKRQSSASSMAGAALMEAFPCQPKLH